MKKLLRKIVLKALNVFNAVVEAPILRWAIPPDMVKPIPSEAEGIATWIEPSPELSKLVFAAAFQDRMRAVEQEPEREQAELNACMEGLRDSESFRASLTMFASLIASGYPIEEVFLRSTANAVHYGIYIERRLTKGDA